MLRSVKTKLLPLLWLPQWKVPAPLAISICLWAIYILKVVFCRKSRFLKTVVFVFINHWNRGEREFPFPVIPKNGGLWFPFPNFGNGFFHSLPVPEFRECLFSFPSRSQILGMDFFIPFPFPNFGNGNFSFPSRSRIDHFKVGNQKGKWKIVRDASIPTFSASSTFHTT